MKNQCACEQCAVKEQVLRYISTYVSPLTGGNLFSGIAQLPVCADVLAWNVFNAVLDKFKAEGLSEYSPFDLRSAMQTTTNKKQNRKGEANDHSQR